MGFYDYDHIKFKSPCCDSDCDYLGNGNWQCIICGKEIFDPVYDMTQGDDDEDEYDYETIADDSDLDIDPFLDDNLS